SWLCMRGGACPAKPSWTVAEGGNSGGSPAPLIYKLRAFELPLRTALNTRAESLRCLGLAMCLRGIRTTSGRSNAPALPADLPGFLGHSATLRRTCDADIPTNPHASAGAPPL